MKLNKYLTEYDDDLTGDVYIDPLGSLVIWSAYGQEIFQNKVNSISNDVRNFTLNLINHTVIKSLIDDESVVLSTSLKDAIGEKRSLQFKQACLVYLENVYTFSVSNPNVSEGVTSIGVLGSSKARKAWDEEHGDPIIYFSPKEKEGKKRYHLLVRQLGLGVSGRYKTPFSQIGFFENQYDYYCPEAGKVWGEVDALLKRSALVKNVIAEAREHLIWLIESYTRKAQMPPGVYFSEVPEKLVSAYLKALPNSAVAGQETRDFWLRVTQLNRGAAGALLKELEALFENNNEEWSYEGLFQSALKNHELQKKEMRKLADIQIIEPLLAELELLFRLARHRKKHAVEDVIENWELLGRNSNTLPRIVEEIKKTWGVQQVISGTASKRLNQLLLVSSQETVESQLRELLDYHKKIMRVRGQQPWVEITDKDTIKTHTRTAKLPEKEERPLHTWVNSYYIPQFKNLVDGFRGVLE